LTYAFKESVIDLLIFISTQDQWEMKQMRKLVNYYLGEIRGHQSPFTTTTIRSDSECGWKCHAAERTNLKYT
jgi:hypothetical protein